jgi:hypothetical protein
MLTRRLPRGSPPGEEVADPFRREAVRMAPTRLLAAAVLAAALALPASAVAAPARAAAPARVAAAPSPVATATAIAGRYWGAAPCAGRVAVRTRQAIAAGLTRDTDAWVTFGSSLGVNDLDAPATTYTACTIHFARWRWPTTASMRQDWGMFCLTMIHEEGHLLGHPHDSTPGSVMAPVFTSRASIPRVCRTAPGR